jgi:redox-sensitive bicupin YhaK (pirin superfamily)
MPATTTVQRQIAGVYRGAPFHWVGDGFHVSSYFPSRNVPAERISPFFMMDYHAPYSYAPTERPRGVGAHPHRGFETVTVAFEGSVAHHDSLGNAGVIGPGDVQWMTAASGILHKEYHEAQFARAGGILHKMDPPRYQAILAEAITRVALPDEGGEVRIIAGEYEGVRGPAATFSPINLWEVRLRPQGRLPMAFPAKENTALLVMAGDVTVNGTTTATTGDFVLFDNVGEAIAVEATTEAHLLLLNGEPLNEPMVAHGPFLMTTEQEIREAFADFRWRGPTDFQHTASLIR